MPSDVVAAGEVSSIVWTGDRFLAVSSSDDGGHLIDSSDGIHWTVQSVDPPFHPYEIWVTDDILYARTLEDEGMFVSQSADGAVWAPVADGHATTASLVIDHGWIDIRADDTGPCASDCPPGRLYIWASPDGVTWTEAPDQASLEDAEINAVTGWGDRYLAAGQVGNVASIWSSLDGLHWLHAAHALGSGARGVSVGGLATIGDTLVLIGSKSNEMTSEPKAWWTTNGRDWHPATVEGRTDSQMFDVIDAGPELLATGPSAGCAGGIWSTQDGRRWACVAGDDRMAGFGPSTAAASETVEVAVGHQEIPGSDVDDEELLEGGIWWRPLPAR